MKIKEKILKNKKAVISIIAILLILILLVSIKGCGKKLTIEQKELKNVSNNTTINSNGVESYRAKISINGNNINQNYTVYNYKNKKFKIITFDGKNTKTLTVDNNKKAKNLKYDYTNTDIFISKIENGNNIVSEKKKIGENTYTIYKFNISKNIINDMLKTFNIKIDSDGDATIYVDENNKIYLVMYDTDDIKVSVSYTRFNKINN